MLSSDEYSFRFDAGVSMPSTSITIKDKEDIAMCIAKHFLVYVCKGELDQLKNGLKHLGVLDLLLRHPKLLSPLLSVSRKPKLTSSDFLQIFDVQWSPQGSNRREDEEAVIFGWTKYVNDLEGRQCILSL